MAKRANEVLVQLPPIVGQQGKVEQRNGTITMLAGKAPSLRFEPGTIISVQGGLWEILYAFRFADSPGVWRYRCEQRESLEPITQTNARAAKEQNLGRGEGTPRVVKELFRNHGDREAFFKGIPVYGLQMTFTTQSLLHGHVRKEGGES